MKRWAGMIAVVLMGVAALAALVGPVRPAYAADCTADKRVMGDNYTLAAGNELTSNLIVLGGNATVAEGAVLRCALVLLGGNAEVAGAIDGDVVVFGGNVALESSAVVGGELVTLGGTVSRAEGAVVTGGESQGFDFGDNPRWPSFVVESPFYGLVSLWQGLFQTFLTALVMGLLALLVVVFWPEQTTRAAAAITTAPGASGGLGLLTLVAVPVLLVLVTLTICLIPVAFVAAVIFAAAILFSWIALGQIVGARLAAALNLRQLSPAVAAGLGTSVLWLLTSAVGQVPCVGWVAWVILSAVGLGAVTLTRFGTRPYLPTAYSAPPPPPAALPPDAPSAPDLSAL